ncbi:MAG TPA: hypothetical protein VMV10_21265 [Pirellulales bacterium]|nr:hypothetical protein [Pirellulales bacterium]
MKFNLFSIRSQRARFWRLAFGLGAMVWFAGFNVSDAQTTPVGTTRVEEDWELVVGAPDDNDNSPQVTCVIAPSDLGSGYAALDVNFHSQPDYAAGGVQIHVWSPDTPMLVANSDATATLQTSSETITWTTRMSVASNALTFQIVNGSSSTWGDFTDNGSLQLTVGALLANLDGYSPSVSIANSGIPYASNRVTSLTLKAIRYYSSSGQLLGQTTTPQVVYPK